MEKNQHFFKTWCNSRKVNLFSSKSYGVALIPMDKNTSQIGTIYDEGNSKSSREESWLQQKHRIKGHQLEDDILWPKKIKQSILSWKSFSNFQLWKEISIHPLDPSHLFDSFFLGGFINRVGSPPAPHVCDVSEVFLEEVDAIDLAISALERFGQAPSVQDEMRCTVACGC